MLPLCKTKNDKIFLLVALSVVLALSIQTIFLQKTSKHLKFETFVLLTNTYALQIFSINKIWVASREVRYI